MGLDHMLKTGSFEWRDRVNVSSRSGLGSATAIGHAWTEWSLREDGSLVVAINDHVALRITALDNKVLVEEARGAATGESMAACARAVMLAAGYDDLLKAHNAMGDLLRSGRSFIVRSEENERAGLRSSGSPDSARRLVLAIRGVLTAFAGLNAALTEDEHAAVDTLAAFLPDEEPELVELEELTRRRAERRGQ